MSNQSSKPVNAQIARRAERLFQFYLPDSWIVRSEENQEDYGIDFEVQLTHEKSDAVTKHIFKVQLKGTYDEKKRTTIKQKLSRKHLEYYNDLEIPTFLFLVNIKQEKMWWINLQNNAEIIEFLKNKNQKFKYITLNSFKFGEGSRNQINYYQEFIYKYKEICQFLQSEKQRELRGHKKLQSVKYMLENQIFNVLMEEMLRKSQHNNELYEDDLTYLIEYLTFLWNKVIDISHLERMEKNFKEIRSEFYKKLCDGLFLSLYEANKEDIRQPSKKLKFLVTSGEVKGYGDLIESIYSSDGMN